MPVRVVHVGDMRVFVTQACMPMDVRVRLTRGVARSMHVLMVRVMHMGMSVLRGIMLMRVLMRFSEMQPDSNCHQKPRDAELHGDGLAEEHDGGSCTEERSR